MLNLIYHEFNYWFLILNRLADPNMILFNFNDHFKSVIFLFKIDFINGQSIDSNHLFLIIYFFQSNQFFYLISNFCHSILLLD